MATCHSCNNPMYEEQRFCGQCGALQGNFRVDVPKVSSYTISNSVSDGLLGVFVGKRADVYLYKWKRSSKWNWAAFLFGYFWLSYRRMHGYAILSMVIAEQYNYYY